MKFNIENSPKLDFDLNAGRPIYNKDYNFLENKPQINGNELIGDKSSADLDIADNLTFINGNLSLNSGDETLSTVELGIKSYDNLYKVSDWLYEISYTKADYKYAYEFMKDRYNEVSIGSCSAVYKDGKFGKNFDWYYNNNVDFVVRASGNGYKSIGVAGSVGKLTKEFVESDQYDDIYKIVPFVINEGVNEKGVFVGVNVVPSAETKSGIPFSTPTTGTNPQLESEPVCAMILNKIILDKCATADEAVIMIRDNMNIYCPTDNEFHFIIGDKSAQYIVEFINNDTKVINITNNYPWMTNYYRFSAEFNSDGQVDYHSLTDHATGITRSDIIASNYDNLTDMRELMANDLKFTQAYTVPWMDEFCGDYETFGNLTIADVYEAPEKYYSLINYVQDLYEHRDRSVSNTWQTTHSCVYDIDEQNLYVIVQEDGISYEFGFGFGDCEKLIKQEIKERKEADAEILRRLDTYIYYQDTPASEWIINHNLERYPSITVVDSGNSVVVGDVKYIDDNEIIVTFNGAFSGTAYLN